MKQRAQGIVAILVLCLFFIPAKLKAERVRSTGIGLRTSFWDMAGVDNRAVAHINNGESWVDIGGTGGHLYLLSRISDRMLLELNFGSVGSVKSDCRWYDNDNYDVTAIIPITLGVRYDLLSLRNRSTARPYLCAGAGPYIIAKAAVRRTWYDEEVSSEWDGHKGAYLGAGLDFRLTSWLGLNFDARHHFIDMKADNEYSGLEYGIGLQFMWGRYGR